MLVDDDEDDRTIFKDAIEQMGPSYEYCEAVDGVEALAYLKRARRLPDFIFSDFNMPRMNGKEFLMELRKDENLENIPFIMYTTHNYGMEIKATRILGADYYLLKPSDVSRLPQGIADALRKAKEEFRD